MGPGEVKGQQEGGARGVFICVLMTCCQHQHPCCLRLTLMALPHSRAAAYLLPGCQLPCCCCCRCCCKNFAPNVSNVLNYSLH
jgi:hypothetical protein